MISLRNDTRLSPICNTINITDLMVNETSFDGCFLFVSDAIVVLNKAINVKRFIDALDFIN